MHDLCLSYLVRDYLIFANERLGKPVFAAALVQYMRILRQESGWQSTLTIDGGPRSSWERKIRFYAVTFILSTVERQSAWMPLGYKTPTYVTAIDHIEYLFRRRKRTQNYYPLWDRYRDPDIAAAAEAGAVDIIEELLLHKGITHG